MTTMAKIDPADLEPEPEDLWRHGAGARGVPYAMLRSLAELPVRRGTMDGAYQVMWLSEMKRRSARARELARARPG